MGEIHYHSTLAFYPTLLATLLTLGITARWGVFSPNCGCYTESTHSPCLSKTEAHIPDISCHICPSSEEGEGPSPGLGEGFSPLRAGRRGLPLAVWSHLLGGSVWLWQEHHTSIHSSAQAFQREDPRGFCYGISWGLSWQRWSGISRQSHTWTYDPPSLADLISKTSHTQT